MKVSEVLEQVSGLLGQSVEVEGIFAMSSGVAQFVSSEVRGEEANPGVALAIDNLKEKLIKRVPAFGGGKFWYYHNAVARGTLELSEDGRSKCILNNIQSLVFFEDNELFPVIENGKLIK